MPHDFRREQCESIWDDSLHHRRDSWLGGMDLRAGNWCTDDGQRTTGVHAEGHAIQGGPGPLQLTLGGAQGDASISDKGFNFGVGLTGVEGKFQSRSDLDPESDTDDSTAVSLGWGPSVGLNAGISDKDNDGHNEYQVGVSGGPVSLQHSTEEPLWELGKLALMGPTFFINSEFLGEVWDGVTDMTHPKVPVSKGIGAFVEGFERGRDSVPSGLVRPPGPMASERSGEDNVCRGDPSQEHPYAHYAD